MNKIKITLGKKTFEFTEEEWRQLQLLVGIEKTNYIPYPVYQLPVVVPQCVPVPVYPSPRPVWPYYPIICGQTTCGNQSVATSGYVQNVP